MNLLYGNSLEMMKKSLDYLWLRQSVTTNNIANADTVGFKASYVTFENEFQNNIKTAQGGSAERVQTAILNTAPKVHTSTSEGLRLDGNNVNAEVEMIELNRTYMQYQYGVEMISRDISRLTTAIKGQ